MASARGRAVPCYADIVTALPESLDAEVPEWAPEAPRGEWWSDEPPMETYRHLMQMLQLIATLRWLWRDRTDYFVGGNLTVYYSPQQRKSEDFRGPDFFVVLGVDGTRPRRSWVIWEEDGKAPNVIVELLSNSTARLDRGVKKQIYQEVLRTPEYFLFDPESGELEGFRLIGGRYESIAPDASGRLASTQLELGLGVVDGTLRFLLPDGTVVATPEEDATTQARRAEAAEAELRALKERVRTHDSSDGEQR